MRRVLVCGGRDYKGVQFLRDTLDEVHAVYGISTIIHGAARGADQLAGIWAYDKGIPEIARPANWNGPDGKAAGFVRNQAMLDELRPDLVIAFPGGNGTKDMIRRALKAGVDTWVL